MPEPAAPTFTRPVPAIYFNGFELGLSNSDIVAALSLSNAPVASVFMSYTTAKSLAKSLNEIILHLESITKREIMTSDDVAAGMVFSSKGDPQ
jgi:hypothetical protein